jgi:hypothetical protein
VTARSNGNFELAVYNKGDQIPAAHRFIFYPVQQCIAEKIWKELADPRSIYRYGVRQIEFRFYRSLGMSGLKLLDHLSENRSSETLEGVSATPPPRNLQQPEGSDRRYWAMAQSIQHDQATFILELSAASTPNIHSPIASPGPQLRDAIVSIPLVQNIRQVRKWTVQRGSGRIYRRYWTRWEAVRAADHRQMNDARWNAISAGDGEAELIFAPLHSDSAR